MGAFSFGAPFVLLGLIALPVIWWLLRLTPPKPQTEIFPPLRILARVMKKEETPHQSPWWLTLLRLLMAALIIMALAEPVHNPRERLDTGGGAVAIVLDNGWASAPTWELRAATAERLISDAAATGAPVVLALTAERANAEIGPFDGETARNRLAAVSPRPVPVDRAGTYARVAAAIEGLASPTVAILTDGIATPGDEAGFAALREAGAGSVIWAQPEALSLTATRAIQNLPEHFEVALLRPAGEVGPRTGTLGAFDDRGRRIADTAFAFAAGSAETTAQIAVPFELRNDFASVQVDGEPHAGATRVLDENSRRRRVGLISQAEADQAQPLLSPLYYIRNALQPFADLVEAPSADLGESIPAILDQRPAVIVMADVGIIPDAARERLVEWVNGGGTLLRFAGSRLAASENDEDLLPVRLRLGERSLGGTLSWTEPQPVTEFPAAGPFADLAPPQEVSVTRQVLAEPSVELVDHTWASLGDGTPLVTGAARGDGRVVLFHVTPEATWSNLPISGSFVEMLRRVVQLSRNQGVIDGSAGSGQAASLPPYRMIAADGALVPPPPEARPLETVTASPLVTLENPPGLYGTEEGLLAHNLLADDATLEPLVRPDLGASVTVARYQLDESRDLKGAFFVAAALLMVLDTLAVLWLGGALSRMRVSRIARPAAIAAILAGGIGVSGDALANDVRPGDQAAIDAISTTRIAYVVTGNASLDAVSRSGLRGLTQFLIDKTALEPGEPAGIDIATDELSFYPLIYWPIDPGRPMPGDAEIARIDAYMQQGGTVLFDTRDQFTSGIGLSGAVTPATQRLRDILAGLNIPPLEPVPDDHVLTKAFFILNSFPGRYAGSPLWVEASTQAVSREDRPVRTGDGVSPIMITGNDFAAAWATDNSGAPLYPTVPADPMQRVYAFRSGVNIMMYMLTGNYKSDQVHVPIILERLGQ